MYTILFPDLGMQAGWGTGAWVSYRDDSPVIPHYPGANSAGEQERSGISDGSGCEKTCRATVATESVSYLAGACSQHLGNNLGILR